MSFRIGRFEDVELPSGAFAAAFSATAFHWVDPSVGWAKVARLLQPGRRVRAPHTRRLLAAGRAAPRGVDRGAAAVARAGAHATGETLFGGLESQARERLRGLGLAQPA